MSHTPLEQGKLLRVSLRLTNPQVSENDLVQETLTSPHCDLVPDFSVTFPELIHGMLISFAQATKFKLRQGEDTRSIVITVPALPGAKDFVAEQIASPAVPGTPAAAPPPPVAAAAVAAPAIVVATATAAKSESVAASAAAAPPAVKPAVAPQAVVAPPLATIVPAAPPAAPTAPPAPPVTSPPATSLAPAAATAIEVSAAAPAAASTVTAVAVGAAPSSPAPVAAPAVADAAVPAPPVLSGAEIERLAKNFIDDAHKAIADKDLPKALNRLNRVLGLPPNSQSEAAQALIGEVRESNGEIAKARAEYDLFLKLYPTSKDVPRIKARLAALPSAAAVARAAVPRGLPKDAPPAQWAFFGGISQYWYHGNSHIETTTPPPPGQLTFNTDTLSLTDQDSLISSIDLNARKRDAITDTRAVFRYIDNHNYLARGKGYTRLNAAYFEQTDRQVGYFYRVGRQNPNGGGVMDRFDGINTGYTFNPDWRVNAVAGKAVEYNVNTDKKFYGTSIEHLAQPEHIGYSAYYIQQTLDGFVNRRAVGSETRYFDSNMTVYGTLDYDLDFKDVNIALMQGNYRSQDGTNYFASVDHRKSPSLSLQTIQAAFPGMSMSDILAVMDIQQAREQAKQLTAESNLFAIGFTRPFSTKWQLGADYRVAEVTGFDGTATIPGQPGSGNNHVVSGQAIGNSIFRPNDVAVANVSLIHSPTYNGQSYGLNYVIQVLEPLRLDTSLRFYTQKDNTDEKQSRISPSVRLTYRVRESLSIEGEAGNDYSRTDGPTRKDRSDRRYMYFGYRWDLR